MKQYLLSGLILLFSHSLFAQLTAPSGLAGVVVSGTAVKLTWTDNSTGETSFKVEYTAPNGSTFSNNVSVASPAVTATIHGLQAGSAYQFRVSAANATTTGTPSNVVTVNIPLGAPLNLTAAQTTIGEANVTWADTNTTETGFIVEYTAANGTTYTSSKDVPSSGSSLNTLLNGLVEGSYKIRVRAYNALFPAPTGGPNSTETTLVVLGKPAAPTNIGVFQPAETLRIDVNWTDNATNESGYELEYSLDNGGTYTVIPLGANAQLHPFTVTQPRINHVFRVRAYRLNGSVKLYSDYSPIVSIIPKDLTPAAPTDLYIDTALSTKNSLTIKWKDNANNEEGFELFVNGVSKGDIPATTAQQGVYTVTGLFPNADYTFQLKAYNNGKTSFSGISNSALGRTLKEIPTAVSGLRAEKVCSNFVKLFWLDTNNEEEYFVERSLNEGASYDQIFRLGADVQQYQDNTAPANSSILYRIRATNNGGSSYSQPWRVQTLPNTPATPPINFALTGVDTTSISVKWNNGGEDLDCFTNERTAIQVWITEQGKDPYLWKKLDKFATSVTITPLKSKTTYTVSIRSEGKTGDSQFTNAITVQTLGRPFAPTNLITTPSVDVLGNSFIGLAWKDNSLDEDGFILEASTDPQQVRVYDKISPNVNFYIHKPVDEGVTYYYRVYALNKYGKSDFTLLTSGMAPYSQIPNAPYNLKVAAGADKKPILSWKDDSMREEKFQLERSADNGVTFTLIGQALRNITSFTDATAEAGVNYRYRVRASNPLGASGYTNVVSFIMPATTSALPSDAKIAIYPNPSTDKLVVELPTSATTQFIRISNSQNKVVKEYTVKPNATNLQIGVADLPMGFYLVSIESEGTITTKRIYKQ